MDQFEVAHVDSGDTDVFVSLMYHFVSWVQTGLREIWVHHTGDTSPLHEAVTNLPEEVVRMLPAAHALSGCDTTSKVGTKLQAFRAAQKPEHHPLIEFGIAPLTEDMSIAAERFLLDCMSRTATRSVNTFD